MQQIKIKGAIISNDSIEMYEKSQKEYTALKNIQIPFPEEPLEVIINSGGGDVFTGSEIYSILKNHKGHVTVKIVGVCASSASMVAMAGDTVEMSPTGLFMIHNAMGWTFGNTQEHEKQIKSLEEANNSIAKAYQNKTGLPLSKIRELMKEETWFSCDKAIEYGFVDKEMFLNSIPQSLVASIAQHLPERFHYDYMENVVKKNQYRIIQDKEEPQKVTNNQYGKNLMMLDPMGRVATKKENQNLVNFANNAEKLAEIGILYVKSKIKNAVKEAVIESVLDSQRHYCADTLIADGYIPGDFIFKDGQTIPVAQSQEQLQEMVDRIKGL